MLVIKLSLVLSTLLSVGSITLALASVTHGTSPKNGTPMTLDFLSNDEVVVGGLGQPLPDLLYAAIDDLQLGLAAGTFTSVDLVKVWKLARFDFFHRFLTQVHQRHTWLVSMKSIPFCMRLSRPIPMLFRLRRL
jgi:hypothetical protein